MNSRFGGRLVDGDVRVCCPHPHPTVGRLELEGIGTNWDGGEDLAGVGIDAPDVVAVLLADPHRSEAGVELLAVEVEGDVQISATCSVRIGNATSGPHEGETTCDAPQVCSMAAELTISERHVAGGRRLLGGLERVGRRPRGVEDQVEPGSEPRWDVE